MAFNSTLSDTQIFTYEPGTLAILEFFEDLTAVKAQFEPFGAEDVYKDKESPYELRLIGCTLLTF